MSFKTYPKKPSGLSTVTINPAEPEWIRIRDIVSRFGLSRTHIFKRVADDTFVSKMIVEPGAKRGSRLISVKSVRAYLAQFDREGAVAP
jgi:hypothetical protein